MKAAALSALLLLTEPLLFAQHQPINEWVGSLVKLMTLEEKVGQLNQYSGRELAGPVSNKKTDLLNEIKGGWVGSVLNVKGMEATREIQAVAL